jgi:hypothetical protein
MQGFSYDFSGFSHKSPSTVGYQGSWDEQQDRKAELGRPEAIQKVVGDAEEKYFTFSCRKFAEY